jgi:hypothetical protein
MLSSISIVNLAGKAILNSASTNIIDVSMLDAGIYFIQLYDKNGLVHTKKFIKQ